MNTSFWNTISKPIIALSPMDGVTDAAFRFITDKYGKPDILFTEFTSVEGISHGATKLLNAFIHHKTHTPTVAQVYGAIPLDFYNSFFIAAEMGFDGVDINMGCPDSNIAKKGGGAGLILEFKLAQEIIETVKKASQDYSEGKKITATSLTQPIIDWVSEYKKKNNIVSQPKLLPVSVKTRIGYDHIITKEWIGNLLETEPAAISLHGRTLKQMYTGFANWEEIGEAAKLVKKTETLILGNGDIKSVADGKEKIKEYHLDGVLVGRASYGNPWIFKEHTATNEERIKTALEHCEVFTRLTPMINFHSLRKHLAWYTKGIEGSHEMRVKLMGTNNIEDVRKIISPFLTKTVYRS